MLTEGQHCLVLQFKDCEFDTWKGFVRYKAVIFLIFSFILRHVVQSRSPIEIFYSEITEKRIPTVGGVKELFIITSDGNKTKR